MSRANDIHALIQKIRDDYKVRWADFNTEQYHEKVARDKQCGEIQAKIEKTFPDDFPHLKEGAE